MKRFGEFIEVRKEKNKYRTLAAMMTKALESIEEDVDKMMEKEIQKRRESN